MDKPALRGAADALDLILAGLADADRNAAALRLSLADLIEEARLGRIDAPLEWRDIPGGRLLAEGDLRRNAELERAYAAFSVELTGGETPALKSLRADMARG